MFKSTVIALTVAMAISAGSAFAAAEPAVEAPSTFKLSEMTLEECQSVKGFGPKTCEKVVTAREAGDLTECSGAAVVSGVGKVKAEAFASACTE